MLLWELRHIQVFKLWKWVLLASIGVMLTAACAQNNRQGNTQPQPLAESQNQVTLYLEGAQRQAETDEQRQEILRALNDLRTLDPANLKQRRYADYENRPQQWTLVQLLQKYFVPREPCAVDEITFYRDAQEHRAREIIGQQIQAIRDGLQVFPMP